MFESSSVRRMGVGLVIAVGLLTSLAVPPAALAECTALDRWPSFESVAPTAAGVYIARVSESLGPRPRGFLTEFRVTVQELFRGDAVGGIDFRNFKSGLPLTICPSDSVLYVHVGDVLALAVYGHVPGVTGMVSTVAYLREGPGRPDPFLMPGVETLSRAQVVSALGLPATDTSSVAAASTANDVSWQSVGLLAFAAFFVVLVRRRYPSDP
jgi:hypothetical protein